MAHGLKVARFQWGQITTEDGGSYKDAIVFQRSVEWDWKKFGLNHSPGYTAQVLREIKTFIVANTPQSFRAERPRIYLSTGVDQKIQVPDPDGDSQITYLQSEKCVAAYNADVQAGRPCIIFLHSTC